MVIVASPPKMPEGPTTYDGREVSERIWQLRQLHLPYLEERSRIRAVMNGGNAAIRALLGDKIAQKERDLVPYANLALTANTRMAQKIGRLPKVKIPTPYDSDTQRQADLSQKRESVVRTLDHWSRLRMHMPQIGRWLPGYGFYVWVVRDRLDRDGNPYPHLQLRDPFDSYPGSWGADQQSRELATVRRVPMAQLERRYPWLTQVDWGWMKQSGRNWPAGGAGVHGNTISATNEARWDTISGEGEVVAEYYDGEAAWFIMAEYGLVLDYRENPSSYCPQFVVGRRFTFDGLTGQYGHMLGLNAAMSKLTVMSVIAMQDAVFAETNVYGDKPRGGIYRKGRDAVNYFNQGTRSEKMVSNLPFQMFQQIDRVERLARNVAGYPVTDDSESPVGYATGAAVNQLSGSIHQEVEEYQLVIADALERADTIRLAWDEKEYSGFRKRLYRHLYRYDPRFIDGHWDTERQFGVLSGFDEAEKIVTGIQLLGAGVLDPQTLAENLQGIDDWHKIDQRNQQRLAQEVLTGIIAQAGTMGDPAAVLAFLDMLPPSDIKAALEKYFSPEGEEPSPEEQAMMQAGQGPAVPERPDVQTALSQLGLSGEIKGGSQTVSPI